MQKATTREDRRESLREKAAAVVEVAVARLLEYGRRGKLGALWEAALAQVDERLERLAHAQGEPISVVLLLIYVGCRASVWILISYPGSQFFAFLKMCSKSQCVHLSGIELRIRQLVARASTYDADIYAMWQCRC